MADWPARLPGGDRSTRFSAVDAATSFASAEVAASATQNVKGSWVELIAATAEDYGALLVQCSRATARNHLFDIGVGAAGSETVVAANLFAGRANGTVTLNYQYLLPLKIPAGTRVAARDQCKGSTSGFVVLAVIGLTGGFQPDLAGVISTYGAATGDSGGTGVDPGIVANTKGAWTQISSATNYPIKGLILSVGQDLSARSTSMGWLVDIAVGASGSEQVILADYPVYGYADGSTTPQPATSPLLPADIPAGARISARAQGSSVPNNAERPLDLIVYGVS